MTVLQGSALLHEVARRILVGYLKTQGYMDAVRTMEVLGGPDGIDITYTSAGRKMGIKVKADSYFGIDEQRISDRDLVFYRPLSTSYGLEAIADTNTREPGWVLRSRAEELYYYRLVIAQPESEIQALMNEPDEVFLGELAVERDELRVFPMRALREWFEANSDKYTPRPVFSEGRSAWYRIVPSSELETGVAGVRVEGPVFHLLARV